MTIEVLERVPLDLDEWYEKPSERTPLEPDDPDVTSLNQFFEVQQILFSGSGSSWQKILARLGYGSLGGHDPRDPLESEFHSLVAEWKEDTMFLSSMTERVMHQKYQNIIGMGKDVLPILFRELQQTPDYWFWALRAITKEDPVKKEDYGNLKRMTAVWLNWAREHNYL